MEKTLRQGDHFVVDITSRRVGRRDVVVFLRDGTNFVKRAIAINGDSIQGKDGAVFVNGTEQDEPYVEHIGGRGGQEDWMNIFGPITIPQGKCFVMGDNRDVSLDSRYWGFIPNGNVIGRPMFIYWSFETPAGQYLEREVSQRIGFLAHVVIHFFDETRWKRTFKVVQ
jgi:signal peptidase I